MEEYKIVNLQAKPQIMEQASEWFHQKWGIPKAAYVESMQYSFNNNTVVPQWYVVLNGETIIGGIGVIENDFHDRKDLSPNVCAVYVEEAYRKQGIAGKMLKIVCDELYRNGIDTLYLITEHTSFYERYGWKFLCMVQGDGEPELTRMYIHTMK